MDGEGTLKRKRNKRRRGKDVRDGWRRNIEKKEEQKKERKRCEGWTEKEHWKKKERTFRTLKNVQFFFKLTFPKQLIDEVDYRKNIGTVRLVNTA